MGHVDYSIPITFGVTGHRDVSPQDRNRLEEEVVKLIKGFRGRYPNTPFLFLTALADGADCVVAKAALEADESGQTKLYIVYPFDYELYRKTISQEWIGLHDELRQDKRVFTTKILEHENSHVDWGNIAYAKCGEFVAVYSHVLIVAKDNALKAAGEGGTAEIVQFRKSGCVNLRDINESNMNRAEDGLMYEIRIRRASQDEAAIDKEVLKTSFHITPTESLEDEDGVSERKFELNQQRLAKERLLGVSKKPAPLSKLFAFLSNKHRGFTEDQIDELNAEINSKQSLETIHVNAQTPAINYEAIFDKLAETNQEAFNKNLVSFLYLSALATVLQLTDKDFGVTSPLMHRVIQFIPLLILTTIFLSYLFFKIFRSRGAKKKQAEEKLYVFIGFACLGFLLAAGLVMTVEDFFFEAPEFLKVVIRLLPVAGALCIWQFVSRKRYKTKYQDYRVLAEALRIQNHWNHVRLDSSVADHLLVSDHGPGTWIRRAIRTIFLLDNARQSHESLPKEILLKQYQFAHENWIQGQLKWFARRIFEFHEIIETNENWLKRLGAIWMILYGLTYLLKLPVLERVGESVESFTKIIEMLGVLPVILLGIYQHYVDVRGFGVTYKRYKPAHFMYEQTNRILSSLLIACEGDLKKGGLNFDAYSECIKRLFFMQGISALAENSEWYLSNSRVKLNNPISKAE